MSNSTRNRVEEMFFVDIGNKMSQFIEIYLEN